MLGVSRGTLRTALQRLEESGEIARRQGSGTFVARVEGTAVLQEGLERLVPYSALARERGLRLSVENLEVAMAPIGADVAEAFGLPPGTAALTASRLLLANGEPAALMLDVIHPDFSPPTAGGVRRTLEAGGMVLDALLEAGVPVANAETRVLPRLVAPRSRTGRQLGLQRTTAVLELLETMRLTGGEPVQFSRDIFAPDHLELRVLRWMEAAPAPVAPRGL